MRLKLFAIFLNIFAISLYAQTPPATQTIGAQESRQKDLERQKIIEQKLKEEKKEPQIEELPQQQLTQPQTQKVLIKKIVVEGVTLVSKKEIEKIISQYEGKELTLDEMQKVADLITDLYRKKGYATSRAYLPPQTIKDGILTIKVIEGKVGKIDIKGNKYFRTSTLKKKLKLKTGEYFDYYRLQKSLTYLNEHPDRFTKAVLAPGEEPGTTDIIVEVSDTLPIHFGFIYDNYGSRYIGQDRWSFFYENNNLFGFDDRLYFKFQLAEADAYILENVKYTYPIDDTLDLGAYFSHSRMKLGNEFKDLNVIGKSRIAGLFLNKDLIDTQDFDLTFNFGFDYKNTRNYISGVEDSRDDLRIIKQGFDIDLSDKFGRTIFSPQLEIGIPRMFGALTSKDRKASRAGAGGKFYNAKFSLYRLQPMPFSSSLLLKNSLQYSNYSLPATEQFQIGGITNVRGYPSGEYSGDEGISFSTDWSFPIYFLPKNLKVPFTDDSFYDKSRLVLFYDWASVHLNTPSAGEKKHYTLRSWGWGYRFNLKNLSFRVEVGYPLGKDPSDKKNAHPWIEFSWKF